MENEPVRAADAAVSQRKLYVGSLPYSWTTEQLEELFRSYGRVTSAAIVTDQSTRKSKGFGFIELESDEAAKKAMAELNGKEIEGRQLAVREARPHVERAGSTGDRSSAGGGGSRDYNRDQGSRNNARPNYNHQSLDDTESTDTSGRGYGNRRGWW